VEVCGSDLVKKLQLAGRAEEQTVGYFRLGQVLIKGEGDH
jgi:hypothetical protein